MLNIESSLGTVVRTIVPGTTLLGSRLGAWYGRNPSHKYSKGDILVQNGPQVGFGNRAVVVVEDYNVDKSWGGQYRVTMHRDNPMQPDTDQDMREAGEETHFKWNVEFLFRKVPEGMTSEEAVSLYPKTQEQFRLPIMVEKVLDRVLGGPARF